MSDSVVLTLFFLALVAWGLREESWKRKERRMEQALEKLEAAPVAQDEDPVVIEAAPTGRKFEQRGVEEGEAIGEWMPLNEVVALRILACSFFDTPSVIRKMEAGETVRTRLFEYRLVQ